MITKRIRKIARLGTALLLVILLPVTALGAVPANSNSGQVGSPGNISLDKAIQIVKQNFIIPSDLQEFSSGFDSYDNRQVWRLSWIAPEGKEGSFMAEVDANSGEIMSMFRWQGPDVTGSKIPSISITQARQIGQKLINQLLPSKSPDLVMDQESSIIPLDSYGSYNIYWKRTYKKIPVGADYASMEIDRHSGEVLHFNLHWTNTKLPEPVGIISQGQAGEVFSNEQMLKLQYIFRSTVQPLRNGQKPSAPLLAYAVKHQSDAMIDAFAGTPVIAENIISGAGGMGESAKRMNLPAPAPDEALSLSPEEQQEVEKSAGLITQGQAVEAVKKWVKIPDNMELRSAGLEKNWNNPGLRTWNLNWQLTATTSYGNLWAQVNAANGELLSFHLNLPPAEGSASAIGKGEAKQIAEGFIKGIQPQRWNDVTFYDNGLQDNSPERDTGVWSFNYLRLVNGALCPNDGIRITVDAKRKQVSSYSLDWTEASFPSTTGILGTDKANEVFLKTIPLKLRYTFIQKPGEQPQVKLVYFPEAKEGVSMLDAKTGQPLYQDGQSVSNKPQPYVFNDIEGHFAQKEISLLGQAGIFGEYGNSFHPDENITLRSLLKAMLASREGIYGISKIEDQELINRCQRLGWIKENADLNSQVSRDNLSLLMLRFLEIEYLTQIEGIYQVPYQDTAQLSPTSKAAAALTWGLGIIKADGKNYDSAHIVSRGETAAALVHTLAVNTRP
ncbi:MAG: S-layer homology domain-containing protein [Syntrophomonadaceae bacterium]|nr:S-layer homology domain-containing protein [Syntrophomonadaceae bacterium]